MRNKRVGARQECGGSRVGMCEAREGLGSACEIARPPARQAVSVRRCLGKILWARLPGRGERLEDPHRSAIFREISLYYQ